DAQTLLLATRERHATLLQLVLYLVEKRRLGERQFDPLLQLSLRQIFVQPDAERDIFVDRHRKRRRFLEHHADLGAEHVQVDRRVEQIFAVEYDLAGRALAGVERIHSIERAQQRRLAATGRPDERRHMTLGDIEIDVLERVEFA